MSRGELLKCVLEGALQMCHGVVGVLVGAFKICHGGNFEKTSLREFSKGVLKRAF